MGANFIYVAIEDFFLYWHLSYNKSNKKPIRLQTEITDHCFAVIW